MGNVKLDEPSTVVAATLAEAGGLLDEAAGVLEGLSSEVKDGRQQLYRAESAVGSGQTLVALTDPSVMPLALANQVKKQAQELRDNVVQAAEGGGGSIEPAAEALLSTLTQLRQPGAPIEEKAKEAARRYSQSLAPRLGALSRAANELEARFADLNEAAVAQEASANERLESLQSGVETVGARVDELISDQDKKFSDAQERRREEHANRIEAAISRLDKASSDFETRRDAAVERLDEIEGEVAETAAALGGRAVAAGYGAEGKEQARRAFWWSVLTIALLLVAVFVPAVFGVLQAKQSPESVAGKITIALVIAGAAGYAGNLAHHHRERAARARRLEIEMSAFGPFITTLDQADQDRLRSMIVWKFFGAEAGAQEVNPPTSSPIPGILGLGRRRPKEKDLRNGAEPSA
jgi:hypothetical protein